MKRAMLGYANSLLDEVPVGKAFDQSGCQLI